MKEIVSLDEIKKIELDIMKEIHFFCKENNITYYLAFGTLLGAIRHKGFIPWDDDIDIHMKRDDYNVFINLFPEWCKDKNLAIANMYTKPYYGRPMTKVYDTRTHLIETDFKCDDPYGVFVDIWILDGVPNLPYRFKWLKKVQRQKRIMYATCYKMKKEFGFKKNLAILLCKFLNQKKQASKFDRMASKYPFDCSDAVMSYLGMINCTEFYEKKAFNDKILIDFEDTKFYAPCGYDSLLKAHFGDYMKMPPEDKRKPHHIVNTYWKD